MKIILKEMNNFLKIAGDHSNWNVYKKSVIVCDVTEFFINRYVKYSPRTQEQMRQAARSCKQNIVEGAGDKTVSFQMCINLIGIAKSSARELLEDYGDFLRQHDLKIWDKDDPRTIQTRRYCINHTDPSEFIRKCKERSAEVVANIMLTQLRQIDSMLANVLKKLEAEFISEGGIKEAMTKVRRAYRDSERNT